MGRLFGGTVVYDLGIWTFTESDIKIILYLDLQVDQFENKNFSSNYVVVTLKITAPYIQNELDI